MTNAEIVKMLELATEYVRDGAPTRALSIVADVTVGLQAKQVDCINEFMAAALKAKNGGA
jgi:hypothetical protein